MCVCVWGFVYEYLCTCAFEYVNVRFCLRVWRCLHSVDYGVHWNRIVLFARVRGFHVCVCVFACGKVCVMTSGHAWVPTFVCVRVCLCACVSVCPGVGCMFGHVRLYVWMRVHVSMLVCFCVRAHFEVSIDVHRNRFVLWPCCCLGSP